MLEKLKKALDEGLTTGILLTDLTNAFECISRDLLIAELNAYRISKVSLNLIYDYKGEHVIQLIAQNSLRCSIRLSIGSFIIQYLHE